MTDIPNTMFDFSAYYDQVAISLPRHCRIAEVGCADGASAIYLAHKLNEIIKPFHLRMIDSLAYGGADQLNTLIRNVQTSGLSHSIEILPYDSLNASLKFPGNYFHMVFLDSGHEYELTKAEIRLWYHKVIDGGFLAGHDYTSEENPGVKQAVDELIDPATLSIVETEKGYGVWLMKKDVEIKLLL